jgi:hypothetical protein
VLEKGLEELVASQLVIEGQELIHLEKEVSGLFLELSFKEHCPNFLLVGVYSTDVVKKLVSQGPVILRQKGELEVIIFLLLCGLEIE